MEAKVFSFALCSALGPGPRHQKYLGHDVVVVGTGKDKQFRDAHCPKRSDPRLEEGQDYGQVAVRDCNRKNGVVPYRRCSFWHLWMHVDTSTTRIFFPVTGETCSLLRNHSFNVQPWSLEAGPCVEQCPNYLGMPSLSCDEEQLPRHGLRRLAWPGIFHHTLHLFESPTRCCKEHELLSPTGCVVK